MLLKKKPREFYREKARARHSVTSLEEEILGSVVQLFVELQASKVHRKNCRDYRRRVHTNESVDSHRNRVVHGEAISGLLP